MRKTLEIPVYESKRWKYIIISDLEKEKRRQLEDWIFGRLQPLIQGEKRTINDAVFLEDYLNYLESFAS